MNIIRVAAILALTMSSAMASEHEIELISPAGEQSYDGIKLKQNFNAEYGTTEKTQRNVRLTCKRGSRPGISVPIDWRGDQSERVDAEMGKAYLDASDENDANERGSLIVANIADDTSGGIYFRSDTFNEKFLLDLYTNEIARIRLESDAPFSRSDRYTIFAMEAPVKEALASFYLLCRTLG